MLSFPVYREPHPRTDLHSPDAHRIALSVFLIHPLSFQGFPHSFPQWTTPISFSFNRFRTLSIAMVGKGVCPFENLNHYFNFDLFANYRPVRQILCAPVFSSTYELPIFYLLCFDIHACNGGVYPPQSRSGRTLCALYPKSVSQFLCNQTVPHSFSKLPGVCPPSYFGARSAAFLVFDLCDSRLHHLLDQCGRQWLVRGKLDGPLGGGVARQFILKRFDHRARGEQTAVVGKRGEPHQHSLVLERGNPVADGLGSLRWRCGANRRANLSQGATRGFRNASKVFVHVLRTAARFRRRAAAAGFRFFHPAMLQEHPVQVHAGEYR